MAEVIYINAKELQELHQKPNLAIFDIREADEFAREHIVGAQNTPISKFDCSSLNNLSMEKTVVFNCQSGNRTKMNEDKFKTLQCDKVYVLKNGLTEWKNLGCAIAINNKAPLPLMRQVQIVAGFLVLLGLVLSFTVSSYFSLLSGFVGAGLMFAGISGYCGMANLLMLLPYNKSNSCNSTCSE